MLEKANLKYWAPFLAASKDRYESPVSVIYGLPDGKAPLMYDEIIDAKNVLVYGSTGSGKSMFLHVLIQAASLANTVVDVRLVLVDPTKTEFHQYRHNELLLCPIISEQSALLSKIHDLMEECERRETLFGDKDFELAREESAEGLPYILLVIDEYADIASPAINEALSGLLQVGHRFGIHVALSTQSIRQQVAETRFFKQFKTIVSLCNEEKAETSALLNDYAELEGGGDSLVSRGGRLSRVQGLFTSGEENLLPNSDDFLMSAEAWVFELLAKHNDEVLIPLDESGEILVKEKTVAIYNAGNPFRADRLDKHKKTQMKFWEFMEAIQGKSYCIRLENSSSSFYSRRLFEGRFAEFHKEHKERK